MKPRYRRTGVPTEPRPETWAQPGDGSFAAALMQASARGLERISATSERHTPASSLGDAFDTKGKTL
jgi:hypothetical protein